MEGFMKENGSKIRGKAMGMKYIQMEIHTKENFFKVDI
jgi:hypothetical protein